MLLEQLADHKSTSSLENIAEHLDCFDFFDAQIGC